MTAYKRSAITAKEGINFVRSVVEKGGSLFHKIEQENDFGIDAHIEFVQDEKPLGKQVAAQIKSGASYFKKETSECVLPVKSHRNYWLEHQLEVVGFVYVPAVKCAYWVNIKKFLKRNPSAVNIRFLATEANRLEETTFLNLFQPSCLGREPVLPFGKALRLTESTIPDEVYLGIRILFRRYQDEEVVWDRLIGFFRNRSRDEIPPILIYWISHVPGHGDIFYYGTTMGEKTRSYARAVLAAFDVNDVIKLLSFIDPEEQIGRGTLGQSVEAIISSLPNSANMLREVIRMSAVDMTIRDFAALILAMNENEASFDDLDFLKNDGSCYAEGMKQHLKRFGHLNPY